ncbi:1,4-dihydroxy-2-naphthoate polyprenyltransferase [Nosocomiicoccus ampullae]|uniref:1,4-dihydroxy-2-naphthoate octaprenyltransferase n=1 Tax=Nosocomiicoccus ampullae TaxID=489910 RepID=A0A9Q2CXS2_9STAP|nr:1,4-dihydroxy-2-naphthoate polyprenyltransferase [Nosocomiicoccus ampullae]MBB5175203.1 1,4-dihydroxy-2-naphthoate octaprenyltransferase [Nosocomiicoccus ampullae]QYA46419.1 1,4-dihydroxy-2-naphthoate polyprenyltransferase [Nosocomiicoccus ampullae]QYA47927.1 1,4-dihydroxy-2-naphthoate polyprenyltransferase [Nosocomiicoccus ampullae]
MQHAHVLTGYKKYISLTRPHTLTAGFVPVLVGTAAVLPFGDINFLMFFLMLIATILIQSATNMFNEYYDFKRGLDSEDSVGIAGAIVRNGITPRRVLSFAISFYIIAALIGLYIAYETSWWLILIGSISMLVGFLYTGGPYPISWTPFGEIFSGVFMGPVIILITFYIHLHELHIFPLLLSIPIMITIGLLNMFNNIRDRVKDAQSGRRTFVILVGKEKATQVVNFLLILCYVFVIIMSVTDLFASLFLLLPLLSFKLYKKTMQLLKDGDSPVELIPAMAMMGKFNTIYGLLLSIGVLLYGLVIH